MYTQSITRTRRTAFVLLLDCSGSMNEQITLNGHRTTKAQAVATVANQLLFELTERARRSDGIRDYYDVAVIGYSGEAVTSLLGESDGFHSIVEVERMGVVEPGGKTEYFLPDGRAVLLDKIPIPEWIAPRAQGETPMYEALLHARNLIAEWVRQPGHAQSFPPVVFNITDGETSDCDEQELREICTQIRGQHTDDGEVLLINIHIASGTEERSLIFPTADEASYGNRYAALLYDCSSQMPAPFEAAIRDIRGGVPPFRGMSYNASVPELVSVLNIGSISVKTE